MYVYAYVYNFVISLHLSDKRMYVHVYACMDNVYVCMCVIFVLCMYVHVYACMDNMYVCM